MHQQEKLQYVNMLGIQCGRDHMALGTARVVTKKYTFRFQNEAYMYMRENNYMMLSAIDIDDEDQ